MRNPIVQFAAAILAVLGFTGGVFLGLSQIHTQVTTVGPPSAQVQAPCGISYVPSIPALSDADPVPLVTDSKVLVPRATYTEQCDRATSWQPYVSWTLTGFGLLGLVVIFIASRRGLDDKPGTGFGSSAGAPQSSPLWH